MELTGDWTSCFMLGTGTSLNSTRYVSIRAQAVVWLPEQAPVVLDCEEKAVAAFGPDLNLSSIEWLRNDIMIVDNSTIRNIFISPNNLQLLISALTIRTGAENGTEDTYTNVEHVKMTLLLDFLKNAKYFLLNSLHPVSTWYMIV